MTENLLDLIQDPMQNAYHQQMYKEEHKGKKKEHYIDFLQQLKRIH